MDSQKVDKKAQAAAYKAVAEAVEGVPDPFNMQGCVWTAAEILFGCEQGGIVGWRAPAIAFGRTEKPRPARDYWEWRDGWDSWSYAGSWKRESAYKFFAFAARKLGLDHKDAAGALKATRIPLSLGAQKLVRRALLLEGEFDQWTRELRDGLNPDPDAEAATEGLAEAIEVVTALAMHIGAPLPQRGGEMSDAAKRALGKTGGGGDGEPENGDGYTESITKEILYDPEGDSSASGVRGRTERKRSEPERAWAKIRTQNHPYAEHYRGRSGFHARPERPKGAPRAPALARAFVASRRARTVRLEDGDFLHEEGAASVALGLRGDPALAVRVKARSNAACVQIHIDRSGSMGPGATEGERSHAATMAACGIIDACRKANVPVQVIGFQCSAEGLVNFGEKTWPHPFGAGGNDLPKSLATGLLLLRGRPEPRRIVIAINDGDMGNRPWLLDIRRQADRMGAELYCIGIAMNPWGYVGSEEAMAPGCSKEAIPAAERMPWHGAIRLDDDKLHTFSSVAARELANVILKGAPVL